MEARAQDAKAKRDTRETKASQPRVDLEAGIPWTIEREDRIHHLVIRMLAATGIATAWVDYAEVRELFAELNANFKPRTSRQYRNIWIPKYARELEDNVKADLQQNTIAAGHTVDNWTQHGYSFMTTVAHIIDKNYERTTYNLCLSAFQEATINHQVVFDELNAVLNNSFGETARPPMTNITSDSGSNMVKAFADKPKYVHSRCLNHILHNIVTEATSKEKCLEVFNVINAAEATASYVKNSHKALVHLYKEQMKAHQRRRKPKLAVCTR